MKNTRVQTPDRYNAKFDLPPTGTMTWGIHRKAAVVVGIRSGLITRDEACERYLLSPEELAAWEAAFDQNGTAGLLAKRMRREL
jgi:Protein of unknown function (DUF1153)